VKDLLFSEFQSTVQENVIRHKSLIDGMTKLEESVSRVNRAIAKSVTSCGCIQIVAEKHAIPEGLSLGQLRDLLDTGVRGQLCESCQDAIESELGSSMYYLTSLMNALGLSLYDCLLTELQRVKALGVFNGA
jgi:hypothetical protein